MEGKIELVVKPLFCRRALRPLSSGRHSASLLSSSHPPFIFQLRVILIMHSAQVPTKDFLHIGLLLNSNSGSERPRRPRARGTGNQGPGLHFFHEPDTLFFRVRKIIYRASPFYAMRLEAVCDWLVFFFLASLGAMKPMTALAKARPCRVCIGPWMSSHICFYAPSRRGVADTRSSWFYRPQEQV